MNTTFYLAELQEFFVEAIRNGTRIPSQDPGKRSQYAKGQLAYTAAFIGLYNYLSEKVILKNGDPIWCMSAYGCVLSDSVDRRNIYQFLEEVLLKHPGNAFSPRGPKVYRKLPWTYVNEVSGTFDCFSGIERILLGELLVYKGFYHGGLLSLA